MQFRVAVLVLLASLLAASAEAYGPDGHHLVGAIADERLANTPTGKKVALLLDGMTLREAAQVPDTIKGWDTKGVDDPKNAAYFSSRPRIAAQLREFWKANQPTHDPHSPMPSHHWFHYTDVPVEAAKYSAGETGRSQWDIVHMISYCVAVLRGEVPEENPRKITKPVAIILLAHYLGDIHQPLHVGAEYFDVVGQKVNPDSGKPALEDQGGNAILLEVSGTTSSKRPKLHGFWDNDPVKALFPGNMDEIEKDERKAEMSVAEKALVQTFATQEPKGWRLPASVPLKDYAEAWADEMLPIAREAHERLTFQGMTTKQQDDGTTIATGSATEKPMPDHLSYRAWSSNVVRAELPKAGWRLADLLEKALGSTSEQTTPVLVHATAVPSPSAAPVPSVSPVLAPAPSTAPAKIGGAESSTTNPPYGAYPTNYKDIVRTWLRTIVPDPANTTIQWQTEPKPADLPDEGGRKLYGFLVIFSTGTKNSTGVSSKMQPRGALIHDGVVVKANGF